VSERGVGSRPVRVRFAPAPSGDLHVGNIRTALYNWAFARRHGGTFVFRLEDTDRSRATDEAYSAALDVLAWMGLDWDEGPGKGGPYAPYRQSERLEIYAGIVAQLQEQGAAYPCYCSREELEVRSALARRDKRPPGYDGHCRSLSPAEVAAYEAAGRRPGMRFRMPPGSSTFVDLVRGEVTFDHALIPDFALTRSDGHPLYLLAATVDDVLMGITHIIRGEDLLSAVPRQLAMYAALGEAVPDVPRFAHLPLITGDDGKPLSKRNGEVSIAYYRREGFLPEAMVNYLALLGWSPGDDVELFSPAEMVASFDVERVSKNPARFDVKKLEAINGEKIRGLDPTDFFDRLVPVLQAAGLVAHPLSDAQQRLVNAVAPLVQTRLSRLGQAPDLLRFLFVADADFLVDPGDAAKTLLASTRPQLQAAYGALAGLAAWKAETIETALRAALVDGLGIKPRHAFSPLYVAVTGRRVAPPLFDSMELLGRDATVRRLQSALAALPAS
jgi:glutamyl-tRNA synthetase